MVRRLSPGWAVNVPSVTDATNTAAIVAWCAEAGTAARLAEALALLEDEGLIRQAAGEAGRKMVEENRGALAANMRLLEQLLGN